jgi:tetratricopeptide (TPR) repeat protein
MANSARNQPGAVSTDRPLSERPLTEEEINPLTVGKLESFYEVNKKMISTATTVILVVIVGYFAYTKLYKGPAEDKASTALSIPQLYFQADSLNMALNGDGKNLGFEKITKKYSGTAAGNLAYYYKGMCELKMGDYKNAIKSFKEFDGKGTMLGHQAYGALGQAYLESGDNANAIENFKKATEDKNDVLITPMYLYYLGLAYQAGGKVNEAKEAFKRVRDEYPKSMQAREMDKELARIGEVN